MENILQNIKEAFLKSRVVFIISITLEVNKKIKVKDKELYILVKIDTRF